MSAGKYISIAEYLQIGTKIVNADNKYAAEPWKFPDSLRTAFDTVFGELKGKDTDFTTAHVDKEKITTDKKECRKRCTTNFRQLKHYVSSIADAHIISQMTIFLHLSKALPRKENSLNQFFHEIYIQLDNWDGTPGEIPGWLKDDIRANTAQFQHYVIHSTIKRGESLDSTAERKRKLAQFKAMLFRIRNWLYLKLPNGKHDPRLGDYGFDPHKKRAAHRTAKNNETTP